MSRDCFGGCCDPFIFGPVLNVPKFDQNLLKEFEEALKKEIMKEQNKDQSDFAFITLTNNLAEQVTKLAFEKGFWPADANLGSKIALIHAEVSEALEALRDDPKKPDKYCPTFSNFEIELADAVIRIMDLAAHEKLNLGGAIIAKIAFNKTRPVKHGKKF